MRTALPLSAATAVLMALSCSSGGPQLCSGSGSIPQQTVNAGEDGSVAICFEDPGGGTLTYSASSADTSIVKAFVLGTSAGFRGVSPGQTTVTATATNEGGKFANVDFSVLVPNRPPELVAPIGDVSLVPSVDHVIDLGTHFVDPDGQELAYDVTSSSPTIVDASVADTTLTLKLLAREGNATITVTASDGEFTVTTTIGASSATLVIEESFDSDVSLDDWEIVNASADVENGNLVLTNTTDSLLGIAARGFGGVASEWIAIADVVESDAGAQGGIWAPTDDRTYMLLVGEFNANWNWLFVWSGGQGWSLDTIWSVGSSDALTSFDEVRVTLSMTSGHGRATVDGEVLFDRIDDTLFSNTDIDGIAWVTNSPTGQSNVASRISQILVYATEFTESDFDLHRYDPTDELEGVQLTHFGIVDIPFLKQ